MAIAYVRGNAIRNHTSYFSPEVQLAAMDAGNFVLVLINNHSGSGNPSAVGPDSLGNVYTLIAVKNHSSGTVNSVLYYSANVLGSGSTVTIPFTSSLPGNHNRHVFEFSGIDTVSPIRSSGTSEGNGTSCTGPALSPEVGDLVIAEFSPWGWYYGASPGSGYTDRNVWQASNIWSVCEDKIAASTSETPDATGGPGSDTVCIAAALKPAGGAPLPVLGLMPRPQFLGF